jgi:hypothetical protein
MFETHPTVPLFKNKRGNIRLARRFNHIFVMEENQFVVLSNYTMTSNKFNLELL